MVVQQQPAPHVLKLCQPMLDAWCNRPQSCPHAATHGRLHARYDRAENAAAPLNWRCYAEATLSADLARYERGATYCTRPAPLRDLYDTCRSQAGLAGPEQPTTAVTVAPTGGVTVPPSLTSPVPPAGPPLDLQRWEQLEPWAHRGVLTLKAAPQPEWAPSPGNELLAVHAWRVACMEDYAEHKRKLEKYTGNVSRRKAFLKREGLRCFGACVRGVVDGFATAAEIAALRELSPPEPGASGSSIAVWLWETPPEQPLFATLVARAQAVLRDRFGVDHLRFYRSNMIIWQAQPGVRGAPPAVPPADYASVEPGPWRPASLHGDTNTDEMFLYTTILYLTEQGLDGVGAETGIADEVERGEVTAGLRVQPSVGRLLVFSSGVENMHEMVRLVHGRRVAIQMWFACEGQHPGWAIPQREAFAAKYGYGSPEGRGSALSGPAAQSAPPLSAHMREAKPWPWRDAL